MKYPFYPQRLDKYLKQLKDSKDENTVAGIDYEAAEMLILGLGRNRKDKTEFREDTQSDKEKRSRTNTG